MTIQTPPGGINDPDLPDPPREPDPTPDPEPGGPVPHAGNPPLRAPGADDPPMRLPRENPDVEMEV